MALGGRFHHRKHEVEIIPVFEPVLLLVGDDPELNDYAVPGDFLIIYPDSVEKISCDDFLKNYVCDEAPELSVQIIGKKDLL